jgi:DNA-binding GntR family transcriptional regulator
LKPGARVTEAELTGRLDVGRGTVREAFRILAANGAIDLSPHRGAVIRSLDEADCRNLLEVVEVLLGLAARLAASNIEIGDNRKRFEGIAHKLALPHAARRLTSVLQERLDFYGVMLGIAANHELDRAFPLARAQIFRSQSHDLLTPADLRAMIAEYRAVADAILEGDGSGAEQRMRRHIRRTGERMIPRLARSDRGAAARA